MLYFLYKRLYSFFISDPALKPYCGLPGSGAAVRHVCVALRGGAGPVSVDPERAAERPDGAGGETSFADELAAVWTRVTSCLSQLGAGVSLPGVVAARCGAKVILSDLAEAPSCLENCRRSCQANGVQDVVVLGLTWGDLSPDLVLLPKLDIILGSDVFYDPEGQHNLLVCRFQRTFCPCCEGSVEPGLHVHSAEASR